MSARDDVLRRVRESLADVSADERPGDVEVPRDYRRGLGLDVAGTVERLVERLRDYGADVRRCAPGDEARLIADVLLANGARRVGVPRELPRELRPEGVELIEDAGLATRGPEGLEGLDAVVTGCTLAIAETGTICLTAAPADGRRALTLVPDLHVCIVPAGVVVGSVPEGMQGLVDAACAGRPITLASGPSATSDIEMNRVAGVHGPRRLAVVLVG